MTESTEVNQLEIKFGKSLALLSVITATAPPVAKLGLELAGGLILNAIQESKELSYDKTVNYAAQYVLEMSEKSQQVLDGVAETMPPIMGDEGNVYSFFNNALQSVLTQERTKQKAASN